MKIIEYSVWREMKIKQLQAESGEDVIVKCADCDGDGEQQCDMGHFHDCRTCRGTGAGEHEPLINKHAWAVEVLTDICLMASWVAVFKPNYWPDEDILYLAPFQHYSDKQLGFSIRGNL